MYESGVRWAIITWICCVMIQEHHGGTNYRHRGDSQNIRLPKQNLHCRRSGKLFSSQCKLLSDLSSLVTLCVNDMCLSHLLCSWQWKSSRSILHLQWVFLWTNRGWSTRAESCRMRGLWQTIVSNHWIHWGNAELSIILPFWYKAIVGS